MISHSGLVIDRRRKQVSRLDPLGGRITVRFRSMRYRLVEALIIGGPQTVRQLIPRVYRGTDGGPLSADGSIKQTLWHLKRCPCLAALGLAVVRSQGGYPRRYCIVTRDRTEDAA